MPVRVNGHENTACEVMKPTTSIASAFNVYTGSMQIVWDERKRQAKLLKHGLDFAMLDTEFFAAATSGRPSEPGYWPSAKSTAS